jgi:predicted dehydrogenase
VVDPNIDIIYIATPHSHHYQNARLALESGKNVLCEKSFTVNAAQTKILVELAKQKKLFLMEAVWTRYFPLSVQVRELIQKGEIGEVLRVTADNSAGQGGWDQSHRLLNLDLAGGALLDCTYSSCLYVIC